MSSLRRLSVDIDDPEIVHHLERLARERGRLVSRGRAGVYGFGEAARLNLPKGLADLAGVREAEAHLAAIPAENGAESAAPALAIGALPFEPSAPSTLVVPRVAVVVRPEAAAAVATIVGLAPHPGELEELVGEPERSPRRRPPDRFSLVSARPHADFLDRVEAAVAEIRTGRLDKVVLAREVLVETNRPVLQGDVTERLLHLYPSCSVFAVDGFVGASPELLVSRQQDQVASHPLAGTMARSGDAEVDGRLESALLSSAKERAEHAAVVEAIGRALKLAVAELVVPAEPSIVELRNVAHLGTEIAGRLGGGRRPGVLELLSLLHPTPAVCGSPTEEALAYLSKVEDLDRDRYTGAVGWMDGSGDGQWHVGIRSAVVADDAMSLRLFAGAGIVADSDPETELAETQLKLQAMLAAAVRP
ncbi:MAG: isochorismate synthase [Acidimicrobiales bacterium]